MTPTEKRLRDAYWRMSERNTNAQGVLLSALMTDAISHERACSTAVKILQGDVVPSPIPGEYINTEDTQ